MMTSSSPKFGEVFQQFPNFQKFRELLGENLKIYDAQYSGQILKNQCIFNL